jgi:hypothetical protein
LDGFGVDDDIDTTRARRVPYVFVFVFVFVFAACFRQTGHARCAAIT